MPRLGGDDDKSPPRSSITSRRKMSRLLPFARGASSKLRKKLSLRNIGIIVVLLFILRNFFKNDYRNQELNYLKDSGMTQEEIERYIPKTAEERKKYVDDRNNDMGRMKTDIAFLLQEVHELRTKGKIGGGGKAPREAGLREMDHIHELKRKKKEEQMLKDNPDFKATRRIRGAAGADTSTAR